MTVRANHLILWGNPHKSFLLCGQDTPFLKENTGRVRVGTIPSYHNLARNEQRIVDDGAGWQAGQVISTPFAESLVNSLLDTRFDKKQQVQWTPRGAHLLLQMRTNVLAGELDARFKAWYPNLERHKRCPPCSLRILCSPQ